MQLENLNNDKLRYVARMPRIPTPYARYINLHARVRINSSRYTDPETESSAFLIHRRLQVWIDTTITRRLKKAWLFSISPLKGFL